MMFKVDLSNAYRNLIMRDAAIWKQLIFFAGEFYVDLSLGMGDAGAAHIFQRFMDCILACLRKFILVQAHDGVQANDPDCKLWEAAQRETDITLVACGFVMAFLDDIPGVFINESLALTVRDKLLSMLEQINAPANVKKLIAEGTPARVCEVLGNIIDLTRGRVTLTPKRIAKIKFFLDQTNTAYMTGSVVDVKDLHSLAGCLASASHIQEARHFSTEIWKSISARQRGSVRRISPGLHEELSWWRTTMDDFDGTSLLPLGRHWCGSLYPGFPYHLFTDASRFRSLTTSGNPVKQRLERAGFGGACGPFWFAGEWTDEEIDLLQICDMEAWVNLIAHELFGWLWSGSSVEDRVDNQTTVRGINGKTRAPTLAAIFRRRVRVALRYCYDVTTNWVATLDNIKADDLSRAALLEYIAAAQQHHPTLFYIEIPPHLRDTSWLRSIAARRASTSSYVPTR
jgi:hypothetical protein